ncbi:MAG: hypothetical protein PHS67_00545 [Sphaerochaetaceae bacterium]|jgi:hypothetical protein|nr:hypothetical protein [Sphaerochaetaceae bacterium]MDD4219029.1 hypothetical protein [Sphaerochaetaceae bacterium]MDY0371028.1 hypothetical protein [Sphaerochaetaceae bacterium]
MKKVHLSRRHLYQLIAVVVVLLIGVIMFVIGKQHIFLLDNKTLESNGKTYPAFSIVEVQVNRIESLELGPRDRDRADVRGQKHKITVRYTDRSFEEHEVVVKFKVPLSQEMVLISLPALVGGAEESVWLQPYEIPVLLTMPVDDEPIITDEIMPMDI